MADAFVAPVVLPPGATRFRTAGGSAITHTTLATYAPETTTIRTMPTDANLARYLTSLDKLFPLNREQTDMTAMRAQLDQWAHANPALVAQALGRTTLTAAQAQAALHDLTPAEAARLTTSFVANCIDYVQNEPAGPARHADSVSVPDLMRGRVGVCRNYAEGVMTAFAALKDMQTAPSQLTNTYAQQISGFGHRWNAFYTVQPDHSVVATMTDGVWLDGGTLEVNTRGRLYAMQNWLLQQMDGQDALTDRAMRGDVRTVLGIDLAGNGKLDMDEVNNVGGIAALAQRYENVWLPQQQTVWRNLEPDVATALRAHLAAHGRPAPITTTPTQNQILR